MTWLMGEVKLEMQRMVDNRDLLSGKIPQEIVGRMNYVFIL